MFEKAVATQAGSCLTRKLANLEVGIHSTEITEDSEQPLRASHDKHVVRFLGAFGKEDHHIDNICRMTLHTLPAAAHVTLH